MQHTASVLECLAGSLAAMGNRMAKQSYCLRFFCETETRRFWVWLLVTFENGLPAPRSLRSNLICCILLTTAHLGQMGFSSLFLLWDSSNIP